MGNKNFSDVITYSRATGGTYTDENGNIVAAGPNQKRLNNRRVGITNGNQFYNSQQLDDNGVAAGPYQNYWTKSKAQIEGSFIGYTEELDNAYWTTPLISNTIPYSEDISNAAWTKGLVANLIANSENFIANSTSTNVNWQTNTQYNLLQYSEQLDNPTWYKNNTVSQNNIVLRSEEFNDASWSKVNSAIQTNLMLYSQEIDNAWWTKTSGGVGSVPTVSVNATTAPDGTVTADIVTFNLNSGTTLTDQSLITSTSVTTTTGVVYTGSVYVLAATAGDIGKVIVLRHVGSSTYTTVTLTAAWQRVTITETAAGTTGSLSIGLRGTTGSSTTSVGVGIWGAQLVQGNAAGDYKLTTSAQVPITYSSPDGNGTAQKLVEDNTNTQHAVNYGVALLANSVYTFSCYLKAGERNYAYLQVNDNVANATYVAVNLTSGAVTTNPTNLVGAMTHMTATVNNVGSGWYKFNCMFKTPTTSTHSIYIGASTDGVTRTYTGNGSGIYIWGAQVHPGAIDAGNEWWNVSPYDYAAWTKINAATQNNIIQYSEDYDTWWVNTNAPVLKNYSLYSEDFSNANWTKSNITIDNLSNLILYSEAYNNAAWSKGASVVQQNMLPQSKCDTGWVSAGTTPPTVANTVTFAGESCMSVTFTSAMTSTGYTGCRADRSSTSATLTSGVTYCWSGFIGLSRALTGTESVVVYVTGSYGSSAYTITAANSAQFVNTLVRVNAPYPVGTSGSNYPTIYISNVVTSDLTVYSNKFQIVQGTTPGEYQSTLATTLPVLYAGPLGQNSTAVKIVEDTTNTNHGFVQSYTGWTSGTTYTQSIYAKAGERTRFKLAFGTTAFTTYPQADFDLSNGTIAYTSGVTANIENVGHGWYRCSITATAVATASDNYIVQMEIGTSNAYTGDGTSGMYFFGSSITVGNSWTSRYTTTTSAAVPILEYGPNGANTAARIVDSSGSTYHQMLHGTISGLTAGAEYTQVLYAKAGEITQLSLYPENSANGTMFNLTTGTVIGNDPGISNSTITPMGGGWYRCTATRVITGTTAAPSVYMVSGGVTAFASTNKGLYIWGHEFVNGRARTFSGTNLITNPDFNTNTTGWSTYQCTAASVNSALEITATSLNGAYISAYQTVSVTPGKLYRLTGKPSVSMGTGAQAVVAAYDNAVGSGNLLGLNLDGTGNGINDQRAATIFRAPTDGNVVINLYGIPQYLGQKFYFDDISLIEYPEEYIKTTSAALPIRVLSANSVTITNNTPNQPLANYSAEKLVEGATASADVHRIIASYTHALTPYTLSVYARAAERSFIALLNATDGQNAYFNLGTGAVGSTSAGVTAAITSIGHGWYRCSMTYTPTTAGGKTYGIYLAQSDGVGSYIGDGYSGVYLWGAQLVQGIDAGAYTKSFGTSPTILYTGPGSANNAQKLVEAETSTSVAHFLMAGTQQNKIANTFYTITTYAKAAERSRITLAFSTVFDPAAPQATYNLSNGTTTNLTGSAAPTFARANITSVGNGWYKCELTARCDAVTPLSTFNSFIHITNDSNVTQYVGTGAGVYVYGSTLKLTAAEETTNLIPYSGNFENTAWTITQSTIQRNLALHSENFTNTSGWSSLNVDITKQNVINVVSPMGTNTVSRIVGTNGVTGQHWVAATPTLEANKTYNISVYAKNLNIGFFNITALYNSGGTTFNLGNGTISSTYFGSATITKLPDGWYRCAITITPTTATQVAFTLGTRVQSFTGDGATGVYLWGAQITTGATLEPYQMASSSNTVISYLGPDRTYSARKLVETPGTAHYAMLSLAQSTINLNKLYTVSCYFKQDPNAVAVRHGSIIFTPPAMFNDTTNSTSAIIYPAASFNLTTGAVAYANGLMDVSMTNVGDGWYRCSATVQPIYAGTLYCQLRLQDATTLTVPTSSYADGGSGLLIYGAQISESTKPVDYVRTKALPYYGTYKKTTTAQVTLRHPSPQHSGYVTAYRFIDTGPTATTHYHNQTGVAVSANGTYVYTVYVKGAEYQAAQIRVENFGSTALYQCNINLTDGTYTAALGSAGSNFTNASTTVTSVGNGWYRVSMTYTNDASTTNSFIIYSQETYGTNSFLGSGRGILVWGAQVEPGVTNYSYLGTAAANPGRDLVDVQLNSLLYSEDFSNALWTKTNITQSATTTTAPDGTSVFKLQENNGTGTKQVYQSNQTFIQDTPYTLSFFAKAAERGYVVVGLGSGFENGSSVVFDLSTGTITGTTGNYQNATIYAYPNSWYRCTVTAYAIQSVSAQPGFDLRIGATSTDGGSYTGNGTSGLYLWGTQIVKGLTAGEYVKTTFAPVGVAYQSPAALPTGNSAQKIMESNYSITSPFNYKLASSSVATSYSEQTYSIYLKAGERDKVNLRLDDGISSANSLNATFDLTNGVVYGALANTGSLSVPYAEITAAPRGWYRCAVGGRFVGSPANPRMFLRSANTTGDLTHTGDGSGAGYYAWGAQLKYGLKTGGYIKSASATPKYLASAAVQTNYATQSYDFESYWGKSNCYMQKNLLLYSEQLHDATNWNTASGLVTVTADVAINPLNGSLNADSIVPNTTSGNHRIYQLFTAISGTKYTYSVYVKANGYSKIGIREANTTGVYIAYDISTQTLLDSTGATNQTITSVGNGWYRISFTQTTASSGTFAFSINVLSPTYTSGDFVLAGNLWSGDGTSGIYAWGAQLVLGTSPENYRATTSGALPILSTAPDGTGNATKFLENTTASAYHIMGTQFPVPFIEDNYYAYSVYVKAAERSKVYLKMQGNQTQWDNHWVDAIFDLTAVTASPNAVGVASNAAASIVSAGSGWYKCTISGKFNTIDVNIYPQIFPADNSGNVQYTGDGYSGIYVWGAQVTTGTDTGNIRTTTGSALPVLYSAPDGTTTAQKIVNFSSVLPTPYDAITYSMYTVPPSSVSSGSAYTFSAYVKQTDTNMNSVYLLLSSTFSPNPSAWFNLATGTVASSSSTYTTPVITAVGNGWYRIEITGLATASSTPYLWICPGHNGAFVPGDGQLGMLVWGIQFNNNVFAVDYGRTAGSYVTMPASYIQRSTNLFLQSANIANTTAWPGQGVDRAGGQSDPFGGTNAFLITNLNGPGAGMTPTLTAPNYGSYTFSIYAKTGTRNLLHLIMRNNTRGVNVAYARYDMGNNQTVSVGSASYLSTVRTSITSVGSGWYRCVLSANNGFQTGDLLTPYIYASVSDSAIGDSVYLYGPQLTNSISAETYAETTTTASTNLSYTAPDGTTTAEKLVVGHAPYASQIFPTFRTYNGTTYTWSIYAKNVDARYIQLLWGGGLNGTNYANFDLQTGTLTAGTYVNATITSVGSGWYRCSITSAVNTSYNCPYVYIIPASTSARATFTTTAQEGQSVLLWGAQLDVGTSPKTYQKVVGAAYPTITYPAPDGTTTAQKLVEDATTGQHMVYQNISGPVSAGSNTYYTTSAYFKAGERGNVCIQITDNLTGDAQAFFNVTNGTLGANSAAGAWTNVSSSITASGNGWYRCAVTANKNAGTNNIAVKYNLADSISSYSYTGNGSSGLYIWGAQVENLPYVTTYLPTTTYKKRNYNNTSAVTKRGVLVERARTNFYAQSTNFANTAYYASGTGNLTVTANQGLAPDGSNTATKFAVTSTVSTPTTIWSLSFAGVATTGQSITWSIYLKGGLGGAQGANALNILIYNNTAGATIAAGTLYYENGDFMVSNGKGTCTPVGNGWYRCSVTSDYTAATTGQTIAVYMGYSGQPGTAGHYWYGWGPQLETGSSATSYIPTNGAATVRYGDTLFVPSYNPWANTSQGTFYLEVDGDYTNDAEDRMGILFSPSVASNIGLARFSGGAWQIYDGTTYRTFSGNAYAPSVNQDGRPRRIAISYQTGVTTSNVAINGYSGTMTHDGDFVNTLNGLYIGGMYGDMNSNIKRVKYFTGLKSLTELEQLTTYGIDEDR